MSILGPTNATQTARERLIERAYEDYRLNRSAISANITAAREALLLLKARLPHLDEAGAAIDTLLAELTDVP
jgi:hypothetical protein